MRTEYQQASRSINIEGLNRAIEDAKEKTKVSRQRSAYSELGQTCGSKLQTGIGIQWSRFSKKSGEVGKVGDERAEVERQGLDRKLGTLWTLAIPGLVLASQRE